MDEEMLNAGDAAQEPVVAAPQQDPNAGDAVQGAVVAPQDPAPAREPKVVQTMEENKAIAAMRKELDAKTAAEGRTLEIMRAAGVSASNLDDLATVLTAYNRGITPEELTRQEAEQRKAMEEQLRRDPYVQGLEQELSQYRKQQGEKVFAEDLAAIQEVDPKVQSIDQLGEVFWTLRAEGIDALTAYYAVKNSNPKKTIPQMGGVSAAPVGSPKLVLDGISDEAMEALIEQAKRGELKKN